MLSLKNLLLLLVFVFLGHSAQSQTGLTFNFKAGGGVNQAKLVGQSFTFGFKKYISSSASLGASYYYYHAPVQNGFGGKESSMVHSFRIFTSAHLIKAKNVTLTIDGGPVFSEWQETLKTPENSGGYLPNFGSFSANEYLEIQYSRWGFFGGAELGYQLSDAVDFILMPSYQFDFQRNSIFTFDVGFRFTLD